MKLEGVKGIIFDMGSTLIEFEEIPWMELSRLGHRRGYDNLIKAGHILPEFDNFNLRIVEIKKEYNLPARENLIEWKINQAFERVLTELKIKNARETADLFVRDFYEVVSENAIMCAGADTTLEFIKNRGIKTGLISNTIFPGWEHKKDLDRFGLSRHLDFQVFSYDFGKRKPHASIFHHGLEKIGLEPGEVVYVGDRYLEDVTGPMEIGMKAVLRYREGREYPDPMPDGFPVIRELPELLNLLEEH